MEFHSNAQVNKAELQINTAHTHTHNVCKDRHTLDHIERESPILLIGKLRPNAIIIWHDCDGFA